MTVHQPFLASPKLRAAFTGFPLRQPVAAGETIFRPGEPLRGVYLVLSGTVMLSIPDSLETASAGPGSALGLPAVMGHHEYILTAQAVGEVQLAFVPHEQFMEMLRQSPDLCLEAAKMLGAELHHLRRALLTRQGDTLIDWATLGQQPPAASREASTNHS